MKRESKFVDISGYFAVLYFSLPFELLQNKSEKEKQKNRKRKEKKYVLVLNCARMLFDLLRTVEPRKYGNQ